MAYGIDNIVQQKADAYRSNPNALMQSYEQKKELIDLLALQKIKSEQEAYARDMQAQMQEVPGTIAQQLEQEVVGTERERITQQVMPGMQQQAQMQQAQMQPNQMQQGGLPTQPAPNMARMMQGGIVGYAPGGMVPQAQTPTTGAQQVAPVTPEQVAAFRARLKELNEAKANAFPQEKAIFQQQIQDLLATTPAAIRNAAGGAGMARGGVVGYAPGGEINPEMERLLDALMMAESGGDPTRVGDAGEEGAFQILPSTAAKPGFGVPPMEGDRFDLEDSRNFARQYLQAMIDRYDGDVEAGLIAYNAGFGNADKFIAANRDYDVLPQTNTTQPYVRSIMGEVEEEAPAIEDLKFVRGNTRSPVEVDGRPVESYTQRARRERLEKQEAELASLYPPVAMEEAEMYEPNLPDALTVMQAMDSLSGGAEEAPAIEDLKFVRGNTQSPVEVDGQPVESYTQRNTRERREANAPAEGIAGYFQNIGRQQQLRRDNFRRAVPGAEAAVARAEQEKADGGIGYLRRVGRLQEGAAQRQAEESNRAAKFMAMLRANQNKSEIEPVRPFVNESFKNGGGVKRFAGEDGSFIDTLGDMQRSTYEATKDYMPDFGNIVEGQMEAAAEDPLDYAANAILGLFGGRALLQGGAKLLGPIAKKYGPAALQRAKDLALRATTKPNPAATGPVRPPFRPPAGRVVDPVKVGNIGVGTGVAGALGIKAADYLMGDGEEVDEANVPATDANYPLTPLTPKQEQENIVKGLLALPRKSALQKRKEAYEKEFGGSDRSGIDRVSDFLLGIGQSGGTNLGAALTGGGTALRSGDQAERSRRQEVSRELLGMEELEAARSADLQQIFAESAFASQLAAASDRNEFIADAMAEIRDTDPAFGLIESELLEELQGGEITQLEYNAGVEFALASALSRVDSVYNAALSGEATTPFTPATIGSFDQ